MHQTLAEMIYWQYCTFLSDFYWWFWCRIVYWLRITLKLGSEKQEKWSYWLLKLCNFFSSVIKTHFSSAYFIAAHLIYSWKPAFSALLVDMLIFHRCNYFTSIAISLLIILITRSYASISRSSRSHIFWKMGVL